MDPIRVTTFYLGYSIRSTGMQKDGTSVGMWKNYFTNGQVRCMQCCSYEHGGKTHGETVAFFSNGLLDRRHFRVGGMAHGKVKLYSKYHSEVSWSYFYFKGKEIKGFPFLSSKPARNRHKSNRNRYMTLELM